jgi:hypothetical protein
MPIGMTGDMEYCKISDSFMITPSKTYGNDGNHIANWKGPKIKNKYIVSSLTAKNLSGRAKSGPKCSRKLVQTIKHMQQFVDSKMAVCMDDLDSASYPAYAPDKTIRHESAFMPCSGNAP